MGKILPFVIALAGLGLGAGAGLLVRAPAEDDHAGDSQAECVPETAPDDLAAAPADSGDSDFVKLNNQFVIPLITGGRVGSLVVLSITLEVTAGSSESIYQREPKLRDVLLEAMFDHASIGGFDGDFTAITRLAPLRMALLEVARKIAGPDVKDVLIVDLVRQDS